MNDPLRILAVVGSLNANSVTRAVIHQIAAELRAGGAAVDMLDLVDEPMALFNPDSSHRQDSFGPLQARVEQADVFLLGTPDYHGSMSSALKNFLDHFWREFAGKLFASVVASHEKGLTVSDQVRTVARQCYAWSLPYAVSFADGREVIEGKVADEAFRQRMNMLVRDLLVYGAVLGAQRRADLAGTGPGFLARHRKGPSADKAAG